MPVVDIITFGCRLNAFESDIIRRAADSAGLGDAVIVNTCAVTAEAERQARQAIRRARRERPGARIIVTGCAATLAPERYAALDGVDLVLDNDAKLRVESYVTETPTPTLPACGGGRGPRRRRGRVGAYRVRVPVPARAPICRYSRAATIAVRSASFPMRGGRAARSRSPRSSTTRGVSS